MLAINVMTIHNAVLINEIEFEHDEIAVFAAPLNVPPACGARPLMAGLLLDDSQIARQLELITMTLRSFVLRHLSFL